MDRGQHRPVAADSPVAEAVKLAARSHQPFAQAGAPADEQRAAAYVRVIDLPAGRRPLRTHIDPSRDGSEVVSAVYDRVHVELYHRIGIAELLPLNASL